MRATGVQLRIGNDLGLEVGRRGDVRAFELAYEIPAARCESKNQSKFTLEGRLAITTLF